MSDENQPDLTFVTSVLRCRRKWEWKWKLLLYYLSQSNHEKKKLRQRRRWVKLCCILACMKSSLPFLFFCGRFSSLKTITSERAFGMLTQRFGIFWRPFRFLFDCWTLVVMCSMKLRWSFIIYALIGVTALQPNNLLMMLGMATNGWYTTTTEMTMQS